MSLDIVDRIQQQLFTTNDQQLMVKFYHVIHGQLLSDHKVNVYKQKLPSVQLKHYCVDISPVDIKREFKAVMLFSAGIYGRNQEGNIEYDCVDPKVKDMLKTQLTISPNPVIVDATRKGIFTFGLGDILPVTDDSYNAIFKNRFGEAISSLTELQKLNTDAENEYFGLPDEAGYGFYLSPEILFNFTYVFQEDKEVVNGWKILAINGPNIELELTYNLMELDIRKMVQVKIKKLDLHKINKADTELITPIVVFRYKKLFGGTEEKVVSSLDTAEVAYMMFQDQTWFDWQKNTAPLLDLQRRNRLGEYVFSRGTLRRDWFHFNQVGVFMKKPQLKIRQMLLDKMDSNGVNDRGKNSLILQEIVSMGFFYDPPSRKKFLDILFDGTEPAKNSPRRAFYNNVRGAPNSLSGDLLEMIGPTAQEILQLMQGAVQGGSGLGPGTAGAEGGTGALDPQLGFVMDLDFEEEPPKSGTTTTKVTSSFLDQLDLALKNQPPNKETPVLKTPQQVTSKPMITNQSSLVFQPSSEAHPNAMRRSGRHIRDPYYFERTSDSKTEPGKDFRSQKNMRYLRAKFRENINIINGQGQILTVLPEQFKQMTGPAIRDSQGLYSFDFLNRYSMLLAVFGEKLDNYIIFDIGNKNLIKALRLVGDNKNFWYQSPDIYFDKIFKPHFPERARSMMVFTTETSITGDDENKYKMWFLDKEGTVTSLVLSLHNREMVIATLKWKTKEASPGPTQSVRNLYVVYGEEKRFLDHDERNSNIPIADQPWRWYYKKARFEFQNPMIKGRDKTGKGLSDPEEETE